MAAPVRVEIYAEGVEFVAGEFEEVGRRGSDVSPVWPEISDRLEEIEKEQFASDGARSGHPWAPNAWITTYEKFRKGQSLQIMRASDALYNSLTGVSDGSVRRATEDTFEFGSDLPQMRFHQDRNIDASYPERLPIDLTAEDRNSITLLLESYVAGTVNRRGRAIDSNNRFRSAPRI